MNITGGSNLSLYEVNEAAEIVIAACDPEVNLIFGAIIDDSMRDEIKVTVIATGFENKSPSRRSVSQQSEPSHGSAAGASEVRSASQLRPFGSQNVPSDQLEIPAFLRNRPRNDR
jgi:cell division protein FtsZ